MRKKSALKKIRQAAAKLPLRLQPVKVIRSGAEILAVNPEATLRDGTPVDAKGRYKVGESIKVNHYRAMKKAAQKGGAAGAAEYFKKVMDSIPVKEEAQPITT